MKYHNKHQWIFGIIGVGFIAAAIALAAFDEKEAQASSDHCACKQARALEEIALELRTIRREMQNQ